jgi:hypothetical protein
VEVFGSLIDISGLFLRKHRIWEPALAGPSIEEKRTMSRMSGFFAGVMALALSAGVASASTIDQQNAVITGYLGPSSTPGQSFTPTFSSIDFASFELATTTGTPSQVFLFLFQGAGYGGTLLASSSVLSVTNDASFSQYTFNFSTVALTPGSPYTLALVDSTGPFLFEEEGSGNPYAGGDEFNSAGMVQTGYDLAFSEGTNATPTPEPAPFLMLLTGMLALGSRPAWKVMRNQA